MDIDRKTIKAISSESRLVLLKALTERRKMPTELQHQLGLSGPTIVEHLKILEQSGLVRRIETGHKWIYYELTEKGSGLIKPKFPIQFVLMLSVGMIFVFSGLLKYIMESITFMQMKGFGAASVATVEGAAGAPARFVPPTATVDWITVVLLVGGVALLLIGVMGLLKGRMARLK